MTSRVLEDGLERAIDRSVRRLLDLQFEDGRWQGEVRWNTVLTSQYVLAAAMIGRPLEGSDAERALTHLRRREVPGGGHGMHLEAPAGLFATTLAYLAMRVLGLGPQDPLVARSRRRIDELGGATRLPTWGKFWLGLLGIWPWEALAPLPSEVFLQPSFSPFHPRRWYCHTRLIYLAMASLQDRRFVGDLPGELRSALREELRLADRSEEELRKARWEVAGCDLHQASPALLHWALDGLSAVRERLPETWRRRARQEVLDHLLFEVRASDGVCCSPVNGILTALVLHDEGHPAFEEVWQGIRYWAYEDDQEGLRFGGAHSHVWDTSFAIQALLEARVGRDPVIEDRLRLAARYLLDQRVVEEIPAPERRRFHRDLRRGGWCFSDRRHGWPVSDCTAEALSALVGTFRAIDRVLLPKDVLEEAIVFLESRRNPDGGFGSYEAARGAVAFWDRFNATEMFGRCMTERSYVECTASCLAALRRVLPSLDGHLARRARRTMDSARDFLTEVQRPDGSFPGAWGVCFLYGTWFGIEGLHHGGLSSDHPVLRKAVSFLEGCQRPDGGFGESGESCREGRYLPRPRGEVVQTAWALLGLLRGGSRDRSALRRAAEFLIERQRPDGSFEGDAPVGVFFQTSLMDYPLYRDYFPLWALSRYRRLLRGLPSF